MEEAAFDDPDWHAFVWLAVFGYVVSVARRLSVVQRECERLEADISRGHRTP